MLKLESVSNSWVDFLPPGSESYSSSKKNANWQLKGFETTSKNFA
jgi:hypothetical protein